MMQINFKNFGMNMSFLFTMPASCLRACITVPKMRSCPYKTGVFFVSKKEALFRGQSLLFVLNNQLLSEKRSNLS